MSYAVRMTNSRPPVRTDPHECPVCHHPQVKIQRKLDSGKLGATNYVCCRSNDCVVGMNLTNVDTWVRV
jgi:ssDNA-binding Zn-finger/Zn-ribbon topoisomerase 1